MNNAISLRKILPLINLLIGLIFLLISNEQGLYAQSLTASQGLNFGSFVASNGGRITVSPTGGRSQIGSVGLITSRDNSGAAKFSFTGGTSGAAFSLALPQDNAARLESMGASNAGGSSMTLTNFVSSLGPSPTLTSLGTTQFSVGATLNVNPNQPLGDYGASFNVTLQFN